MKTDATPNRQRGAALLMMMLAVMVAVTAILVSRVSNTHARIRQSDRTQATLGEARQALLDFALVQQDMFPGRTPRLPCPDLDGSGTTLDGEAHTGSCGSSGVSMLGRLPWKTLGTDALRDAKSECLWYAVSGTWKDAGSGTAAMINPDSNGQFQLFSVESGAVIEGARPDERPVAMIFAPGAPLPGQGRSAPGAGDQCDPGFTPGDFLDDDTALGISNALLGGGVDAVDVFAMSQTATDLHNDRIVTISRADMERVVAGRHDFDATVTELGLAIAGCIADYASNNPGGSDDLRMPWPAALALADYRPDAAYDDVDVGSLSGRLPDIVDTSNSDTGNTIGAVLAGCNPAAVPDWNARTFALWQNWKDHFFYVVAESFSPDAAVPSSCSACLSVNGAGQYAAVVMFANSRLDSLGQLRDAPPTDTDSRSDPVNYLEGGNALSFPLPSGTADFSSQPASATFNDKLFCIDAALNVAEC